MSIIKFSGKPITQSDSAELSRWRKFLLFFTPWAREGSRLFSKSKQLTEAYYTAEVSKKENEAAKFAAETVEIAAKTEKQKIENVKALNDEISRIFSPDARSPPKARALQLGVLIQNNPEIADHLARLEKLICQLQEEHDLKIDFPKD
jgi:hypothetical protein